jgi:hypothetical protein
MATMAEQSTETELRQAVARHRRRAEAASASERERDEAIRRAIAAGVTRSRIVELTGLSPQRVDQIRRRARL